MMEAEVDQGTFFSDLFKNDLYLIKDGGPAVVILSSADKVSPKELELIRKIMYAKGVEFDTDTIHYITTNPSSEIDTIAKQSRGFVLVFEGEKSGTTDFKNFEIAKKSGLVPIVQSCSLRELAADGEKKKLLWRVLQQL